MAAQPPAPLARISKPPRSATQSGRANTRAWVLSFAPQEGIRLDPMTGWSGSGDTLKQVELRFDSKEDAVAYCVARGLAHEVEVPSPPKPIKPKVYADNFRFGRLENWSH